MGARIKSGHDDPDHIATTEPQKNAAAARSRAAAAPILQALFLVADAIDRAGPVIGHEDRTVLGQNDVVRPAEIALVAFEPAGCEHLLLGVLSVRIDGDAHDTRTLVF